MSAPDSESSTWDFFQTGGPYWLGDSPTQLWSAVLGKSWFEWTFENSLPPWTTLSNCPSANNFSAILKPLSKVSKIWTWFPSSEIIKWVGKVCELRDLKHVPLQKAAQICNFALVNPNVSLCSARWGEPRHEPLLVAYVISTIISWAGSVDYGYNMWSSFYDDKFFRPY